MLTELAVCQVLSSCPITTAISQGLVSSCPLLWLTQMCSRPFFLQRSSSHQRAQALKESPITSSSAGSSSVLKGEVAVTEPPLAPR